MSDRRAPAITFEVLRDTVGSSTETGCGTQGSSLMQRFYTHVRTSGVCAQDPEGQQFASLDDACENARHSARIVISEEIVSGRDLVDLVYSIHDEAGVLLATMPFRGALSGFD